MYCLFWGSGQTPLVTTDSRFTMLICVPSMSWGMELPRAVAGLVARFWATAPSKWTSPPNPRVTALPSPLQAGSSGDRAVERVAAVLGTVVPRSCGDGLDPPENATR